MTDNAIRIVNGSTWQLLIEFPHPPQFVICHYSPVGEWRRAVGGCREHYPLITYSDLIRSREIIIMKCDFDGKFTASDGLILLVRTQEPIFGVTGNGGMPGCKKAPLVRVIWVSEWKLVGDLTYLHPRLAPHMTLYYLVVATPLNLTRN